MASGNKNSEFFYVVRSGDTLAKIANGLFKTTSRMAAEEKLRLLLQINPHIADPNKIHPGQIIALGMSNKPAGFCSVHKNDFAEMARVWQSTPEPIKKMVEQNWDILDYLGKTAKFLEKPVSIADGAVDLGKEIFQRGADRLAKLPPMLVEQTERRVITQTETLLIQIRGESIRILEQTNIRTTTYKIFRLVINQESLTAWSQEIERLTKLASNFKYGKRMLLGTGIVLTGAQIAQGWREEKGRGIAKSATSAAVGAAAGWATEAACDVLIAPETFGTGMVLCHFIAPVVGNFVGSHYGESWGAAGYDYFVSKKIQMSPLSH